ncbi:GlxA family transcriptional regulator [Paraburkholderia acidisoli]|uniref:Helix-turn-helix domain-containing protein n=1 Tax=Paraburkholderia acidisoli TaxID=2571748 RepID=A0A7Z2GRZ0_9BURK|nr:GlxA family transcriptional regulator [Paraburkholderia acidisoli]QGZ66822.1 helix-turn-helix domain-containing protein [Paraburkholderia acidisoli]
MARIVAILALPGVQLLDVSGPLDVFAQANIEAGRLVYDLRVIATRAGPIRSSSGVRLLADAVAGAPNSSGSSDAPEDRIDTLLVAGAPDAATAQLSPRVREWLRAQAARSRRFGSVCTGAFALAASGLLHKRRLTTHWSAVDALALACPGVTIEADSLYVRDGKLRTAAGVTAGLDLALALVEEDLGRELAMRVASQLVMFFKRPGGQLQFSRMGETRPAGRSALQEVQRWVAANPAQSHRVGELAARVGLSPRHFARLFQSEVGVTPAAWVETVRVAAARDLLETEAEAPKRVATRCGFANADTLRRAFLKHVGVTPAEYRRRFVREGAAVSA